jgi:hypothetical protein
MEMEVGNQDNERKDKYRDSNNNENVSEWIRVK